MSENEIRVLYVQPGKYPEERTIPNTLRALQELVGGDIECCRPWRDSVCVICNDSGKIDGLPPNRLYGHTDFLAGSFVVCGNGGEDFISLTDRQVFLYERLYHMATEIVAAEVEHIVLPQIVSIKQASRMLGLPPYYLRRLCKEVPGVAFQSGIKWYINLGKLVDYYNNSGRNAAG